MNSPLQNLPQIKQKDLKKLVSVIRKNCDDVEMIILFGSYARGDYRELQDVIPNKPGFRRVSDYDILVITKKKNFSIWHKIEDECRKLKLTAPVNTILAHDIKKLNEKLEVGQYFFSDIRKEGIVLYDSKRSKLAKARKLALGEKRRAARENFEWWFERAKGFWDSYLFHLPRNEKGNGLAAFNLHQSIEHSYKTLHLVFTNYCPNEHFLSLLAIKINRLHPNLKKLFPQKPTFKKTRFKLLEYAYIGGRYDTKFFMTKKDLEILAKDVVKLLRIVEEICGKKIQLT